VVEVEGVDAYVSELLFESTPKVEVKVVELRLVPASSLLDDAEEMDAGVMAARGAWTG
jgi:hypothetical protein